MTSLANPRMVHARAPGKLNVFLKVGALLDDGYHDVATAYQAVSLYEDVRAYPAADFSVSFTGGSIDTSHLVTLTIFALIVSFLLSLIKYENKKDITRYALKLFITMFAGVIIFSWVMKIL